MARHVRELFIVALLAAGTAASHPGASPEVADQMRAGKALYATHCAGCHQPEGTGVPGEVPPLAGSDFLARGKHDAIGVVLHGLKGSLRVHGRKYDETMPPLFQLSDQEIADVLTFVYNSWDNPGGRVEASEVAAQRYDRAIAPDDD